MGKRFWLARGIGRAESPTAAAASLPRAAYLLRGAIVVVHGGGVNPAMLLPVASRLSAPIGWTTTAPTSISPSSTSGGGMSGSNIHMGLVAVLLFNFVRRV